MCGVFGVIGPGIKTQDVDVYENLGYVSMLRGTHGHGTITANTRIVSKPNVHSWKVGEDFHSFILQMHGKPAEVKQLTNVYNQIILGHNRHATIGDLSADAAHPFEFDNLIGMHNGTILSQHVHAWMEKEKFHTDSEALLHLISREGFDKTLCQLDDEKDAYALVWFDKMTKKVYLTRNSKRPLGFAVNNKRAVMYYASELEALKYVLKRNNIDASYYTVPPRIVFSVDPQRIPVSGNKKPWKICYLGKSQPASTSFFGEKEDKLPATDTGWADMDHLHNIMH